jgi:hypothetical protein
MSGADDRKKAPKAWSNPSVFQVLAENQRMEHQLRDMRAELASLQRKYWSRWIELAEPAPGQRCGTSLLPPGTVISKRSSTNMRFYGRTSEIVSRRARPRL